MVTVVITDCDHGYIDPELAVLEGAGFAVEAHQCKTPDEVVNAAVAADALICQAAPITASVIERLPRLRVVGRYGVGLDNIDLDSATARGIRVVHTPDFCTDEVADHTMALMLSALRRVQTVDRAFRADPEGFSGRWTDRLGFVRGVSRLRRLTLGIIGCGRIGQAVAHRARGFGVRMLGFDPYLPAEVFPQVGMEASDLDRLLVESDVVTLHVPLTWETTMLIGERELRCMRPSALLVNTSRGSVIDEGALRRALEEGWIAGAALDVLGKEPPSDRTWLRLPNVLYTAHLAFYSDAALQDVKERTARYVTAALTGEGEFHLANPEVMR